MANLLEQTTNLICDACNSPNGQYVIDVGNSGVLTPIPLSSYIGVGGIGASHFKLTLPLQCYDIDTLPSSPVNATVGASEGSTAEENYANAVVMFRFTSGSWTVVGFWQKDVINFQDAGGIKGVGITSGNQTANWNLLKALELLQNDCTLPIYFPKGQWEFLPVDVGGCVDVNNIWSHDHIVWDGHTELRGAGREATILKFPAGKQFYVFRQRTWDGELTIRDLSIVTDAPPILTFSVNDTTDVVNIPGHGLLNGTPLTLASTGTLPAPLVANQRVEVKVIDSNNVFFVTQNASYGLLNPRQVDNLGNPGADTIDLAGHGYPLNYPIVFNTCLGGTLPGGLSIGVRYYVVNPLTNSYQVSLTPSGTPIDITSTGTGITRSESLVNFTTTGSGASGAHTAFVSTGGTVVNTGYHIGATDGSGSDTGTDRVKVNLINCGFEFISGFNKANCDSAVDLTVSDCKVLNNTFVFANIGANVAGSVIENVDFLRPEVMVRNSSFLGVKITGASPSGSHFFYCHSVANATFTGNIFRGCFTNAIQFQDESTLVPAGMQNVVGNNFADNLTHIYGAQAESKRSALNITGNNFMGDGVCQFRGDTSFIGNYFEIEGGVAINIASTTGDSNQQPDVYNISSNTFVLKFANTNGVFGFAKYGKHKVLFKGNVFKRDPALLGTVYLGNVGDLYATGNFPEYDFEGNIYDFNTDENQTGFFLYEGKFRFINERVDGLNKLFLTNAVGNGSTLEVRGCVFDLGDRVSGDRIAFSIGNTGWTLFGKDNIYNSGTFATNGSVSTQYMEFGSGRSRSSISSAATIFIDPTFNEFVVTGTTTISRITVGITGNITAPGAATNYQNLWTGSITLALPSGITLTNVGGNIANGPYTTTDAEAVTLMYRDTNDWLIVK